MTALAALGCVGRIVAEAARLPADPAFIAHDGAWGFRIDVAGDATIAVSKLVREVSGLGLAEAKTALETPRALIPIEARSSHEEIRRRFAALGWVVSFAPSGG
jgi:ribosomal protein L7/L12